MSTNQARGWLRISIIVSVIWFIAFGGSQWALSTQDNGDVYRSQLGKCKEVLDADYEKCRAHAEVVFKYKSELTYEAIPALLFFDLLTIAIGWALIWNVILIVRWSRNESTQPVNATAIRQINDTARLGEPVSCWHHSPRLPVFGGKYHPE